MSNIAPFVYVTDVSVNGTYLKKSDSECAGSQGRGILMGRSNTFLLNEGDELQISETVTLIFSSAKAIQRYEFTPTQEREKAIFARDYLVTDRLLGEGGYGKVLIGIDQATQRQLACKMIRLDHLYDKVPVPSLRLPTGPRQQQSKGGRKRWPTRVAACFREFDILKDLSHPNIVSIQKVFWSNNTIYIFQELVTGGDLFSFLEFKEGRLDNALAAVVIRQVLKGVEYLHGQHIVHRDLKPDNILMTSLEDGARVVITDFGNARFLPEADSMSSQQTSKYRRMFSTVGTLEYVAPEIHRMNPTMPANEGYSKSVDMWSIGSITAAVLTGDVIFTDRADPQYYENPRTVIFGLAAQCDLSVLDEEYHPRWSVVGPLPKDFIRRLLVLEEDHRMTASEALAHKWLANDCYAEDLEDLYARSIQDWQPRSMDSQLVERIFRDLPDLTAVGLPGHIISQDTVSRFFHLSEQRMTQSTIQTLSTSQHWRASTPLPSIMDDYNDKFQYASQATPSPYDTNHTGNISQNYDDVKGSDQQHHPFDDDQEEEPNRDHTYKHGHAYSLAEQQPDSISYAEAQGTYSATHYSEQEGSYDSTESLNNVDHVAYSQHPHVSNARAKASQDLVLVQETPVTQEGLDQDVTQASNEQTQYSDEYQQTQYPEEHERGGGAGDDQTSLLVYETPPEAGFVGHSLQAHGTQDYGPWSMRCKDVTYDGPRSARHRPY